MSISSASSLVESLDPILPRHPETSSLSDLGSEPDHHHHQYQYHHQQRRLEVPGLELDPNGDKRSSSASGVTIKPDKEREWEREKEQPHNSSAKPAGASRPNVPAVPVKPPTLRAATARPLPLPLPVKPSRPAASSTLSKPPPTLPSAPMAANPKRRSLTMFLSKATSSSSTNGQKAASVSPPPTPPHHSPTFPLRPTAPAPAPAAPLPPPLPRRTTLQRDPSGSSSDSSRSSRIRGKLATWASSASSSARPEPPRPPRQPAPPPPSRMAAFPPPLSQSTSQYPYQSASTAAGNIARDLTKRVERLWTHRPGADSLSLPSSSNPYSSSSTAHPAQPQQPDSAAYASQAPILPRPLRAPGGRGGLVFGKRLEEAVRKTRAVVQSAEDRTRERERGRWLPAIALRCLEHLERWGPEEEGIFRISGMPSHVARLREDFDRGADYNLREVPPSDVDPHAVASVFKAYLRELPESLLTHALAPRFDATLFPFSGQPASAQQGLASFGHPSSTPLTPLPALLRDLHALLRLLPIENRTLLRELARLLGALAANRETTRMGLTNLLVVICPSVGLASSLVKLLVEEREVLFAESAPGEGDGEEEGREEWEREADEEFEVERERRKGNGHGHGPKPTTPTTPTQTIIISSSHSETQIGTPPSRRNSLHPRGLPSPFGTFAAPRRRAASVIFHSPASSPGPTSPLPAPPPPPAAPHTPSPPPRLALHLPSPGFQLSHPGVPQASPPSTPSRGVRLLTDFFSSSSSSSSTPPRPQPARLPSSASASSSSLPSHPPPPKPKPTAPPRVSILGKLVGGEDWSRGVLEAASVPPVPPVPPLPSPKKRGGGVVRNAVRTIEEGGGGQGGGAVEPAGGKANKLVRPREKERGRGAFFPFN